ncbi:MAG TPA: hypothetical protein VIF08_02190 [Candidatus Limnocylindrales bacterium]
MAAVLVMLSAPVGPSVVRAATAPANDFFANAVVLTDSTLPYGPVTIDTTNATTEANEPWEVSGCQGDYYGHLNHTVWYRYNATADGAIAVSTELSNFDTDIAVYAGSSIGSLNQVACAHENGTTGHYLAFHAQAGLTYYIQIGGDSWDFGGPQFGSLTVAIKPHVPGNDFFIDAVQLNSDSLPYGPVTLDTTRATNDPNEPWHLYNCVGTFDAFPYKTVWYRFDATADEAISVSTDGSNFDTEIIVYVDSPATGFDNIACAHEHGVLGQHTSFQAHAGLTYYIQIGGDSQDAMTDKFGSLHVEIKPHVLANDYFMEAVGINTASLPYGPVALDTTDASIEAYEPAPWSCGDDYINGPTKTVWYRYDATTDGIVAVSTAGSNFDTVIAVYQGSSMAGLTHVTCAHQTGVAGQYASFQTTAGATYWLQIGGDSGDTATAPYGPLVVSVGVAVDQSDGLIKRGATAVIGNGIYNSHGQNQTLQASRRPRHSATFTINVQNDGRAADRFTVASSGPSIAGFTVKYFHGTTDITAAVVGGSFETPTLAPGSTYSITAKVKVTRTAAKRSSTYRLVTLRPEAAASGAFDAVGFIVKRG